MPALYADSFVLLRRYPQSTIGKCTLGDRVYQVLDTAGIPYWSTSPLDALRRFVLVVRALYAQSLCQSHRDLLCLLWLGLGNSRANGRPSVVGVTVDRGI
jgi:hypothetical protein